MPSSSGTHVESARAREAWADYLAMGDGRSLEKLLERYQTATESPPTKRLKSLKDWSRYFDWQGRLKRLADDAVKAVEDAYQAERQAVLSEGLALDHERVRLLKKLAARIDADLESFAETAPAASSPVQPDEQQQGAPAQAKKAAGPPSGRLLWYPSVKLASDGTQVQVLEFHEGGIRQLRGMLDDIAKETGGRQSKVDITSGGEPIKGYVGIDPERV
jgi:hypothetical protein